MHLHIVNIRDDKNIIKITNSKKISVLLKMVRIILGFRTCEYDQ